MSAVSATGQDLVARYIPRVGQIVIFDGGRDTASCMVFRYGPRWVMFNIRGPGFTAAWPQMWSLGSEKGMTSLEGYVSPPHARLIRRALAKIGVHLDIGSAEAIEELDGAVMCWVTARPVIEARE